MVGVHDICARVQNGFRARLGRIAVPETNLNLAVSRVLYNQGMVSSVTRGTHLGPDASYTPTTNLNIAERRLWITLKYHQDEPVLRRMHCISKPSRKLHCTANQLQTLASGRPWSIVKGIIPGEIIIVSTIRGVMEIQEATKLGLGAALLARAF
ncbi:ribosomal protein S8 [Coemansia reversa NRRL 1564]|uniref:Ribosomal protein S8 n=1 Tax=Coemansia reversa (strain ATCC 12441 / NRRL 1564) TaxID=763665 RepID=A0A2G5B101_COERN|nr:ribosomal protein S8 [Coemansia reversa NRRL 1564]|eukprot:PIA12691.1 ribosomal protein S8 [Coemansia reversa NRRL 1564]